MMAAEEKQNTENWQCTISSCEKELEVCVSNFTECVSVASIFSVIHFFFYNEILGF